MFNKPFAHLPLVVFVCCVCVGCFGREDEQALIEMAKATQNLRVLVDDRGSLRIHASSTAALRALRKHNYRVDSKVNVYIHETNLGAESLAAFSLMEVPRMTFVRCSFESQSLLPIISNESIRSLFFRQMQDFRPGRWSAF